MINPSKSLRIPTRRLVPFALLLLASAYLYAQQPMSIPLSGAAGVPQVITYFSEGLRAIHCAD